MFGISLTTGILVHAALFLVCVHHLVSGYFFPPAKLQEEGTPDGGLATTLVGWLTPFLFTASLGALVAALSSGDLLRDVPTDLFFFGMFGILGWTVLGVWAGRVTFPAMYREEPRQSLPKSLGRGRRVLGTSGVRGTS
ncbi:MAG: hypothetical protein GX442_17730 [Candidatus Riflebacteria bacterium]|nr:hypothetical protein [Candidatus Riflebacteria bacterium]